MFLEYKSNLCYQRWSILW